MNVVWQNCWWAMIALTSASANIHRQPNMVFIMADDMGWNDVSFHGSDQILTPNIDTLAYQGVVLQQYYSEAICTPARTALLTGKYPMRMGMHGFPLFNSEDRGIPLTERLLPSYMKELGYSTHLVGKWHVGMSKPEYLPTSRGYDTHYGMRGGYVDYYTYNKVETLPNGQLMFGLDLFDNEIPQEKEQRYIVDALTDRAVKIIHRHNASRPLFLHVAHNAPHAGNNGAALQPPLYSTVKHQHIAHSDRRLYAEVVSHLDRSIGRLVTALADRNLLDDTIIVFASDNGAPTIGELNNLGVNLPFRGTKFTPWEGGVRVPAFIWHSSFRARVWEGLMHITDWLPTLIAAAGGEINKDIDGINQWNSIVQDGESKRREVLISVEDSDRNVYAAYRAGDYKIIIGNVTGANNNYYGEQFLVNKAPTPDYLSALRSCEAARTFEYSGIYLDSDFVKEMRSASTIKQQDTFRDPILCAPSATSGCLFNVRRDPMERHNLWDKANKIATLLMNRLRSLWALQQRRGPQALSNSSDPANFGYTWTPWIYDDESVFTNEFKTRSSEIKTNIDNFSIQNYNRNISKKTKDDAAVKCEGMTGVKSFLCILRSVL